MVICKMIKRVDINGQEIQVLDWVIVKIDDEVLIGYISDFTLGAWSTVGIRFSKNYRSLLLMFDEDFMVPTTVIEKLPRDTDEWKNILMLRKLEWN